LFGRDYGPFFSKRERMRSITRTNKSPKSDLGLESAVRRPAALSDGPSRGTRNRSGIVPVEGQQESVIEETLHENQRRH